MSTASGERLRMLHESRKQLYSLPTDVLFELPGRPNVVYMIKDYSKDPTQGAQEARSEVSFLFKAFETGQIGPRRLARMTGEKPRASTIHEYLDWTVTAIEAHNEGEYVSGWPAGHSLQLQQACSTGWCGLASDSDTPLFVAAPGLTHGAI